MPRRRPVPYTVGTRVERLAPSTHWVFEGELGRVVCVTEHAVHVVWDNGFGDFGTGNPTDADKYTFGLDDDDEDKDETMQSLILRAPERDET